MKVMILAASIALAISFPAGTTAAAGRKPSREPNPSISEVGKDFTYGFSFLSEVRKLTPKGIVLPVRSKEGKSLGSATRICLQPQALIQGDRWIESMLNPSKSDPWVAVATDRDWLITASHVVGKSHEVAIGKSRVAARVEMNDPLMDLALLSTPRSSAPCAVLADQLWLGVVPTIEAGYMKERATIQIEGLQPGVSRIENHSMDTVVASSYAFGLPSHDDTGPLLLLIARGMRGQSGGAVTGVPDDDGKLGTLQSPVVAKLLKDAGISRLLGMILAVDEEGYQMAALPGPTIQKRLIHHFSGQIPPFAEDARLEPHGARYLETGALHARSARKFVSSGTGGLSDGGTGALSDGGTARHATPLSSGILLAGKRWLSISKPDWNEYEAARHEVREALKRSDTLSGIYADDSGSLRATSPETRTPRLLYVPRGTAPSYPESFSLYSELQSQECARTLGFKRQKGREKSVAIFVFICERERGNERTLQMHFIDPNKQNSKLGRFTLITRIAIRPDLTVDAKTFYSSKPSKLEVFDQDYHLEEIERYFSELTPADMTEELKNDGLRYYQGRNVAFLAERYGGYRVELKTGKTTWVFSGPGSTQSVGWSPQPVLQRQQ